MSLIDESYVRGKDLSGWLSLYNNDFNISTQAPNIKKYDFEPIIKLLKKYNINKLGNEKIIITDSIIYFIIIYVINFYAGKRYGLKIFDKNSSFIIEKISDEITCNSDCFNVIVEKVIKENNIIILEYIYQENYKPLISIPKGTSLKLVKRHLNIDNTVYYLNSSVNRSYDYLFVNNGYQKLLININDPLYKISVSYNSFEFLKYIRIVDVKYKENLKDETQQFINEYINKNNLWKKVNFLFFKDYDFSFNYKYN